MSKPGASIERALVQRKIRRMVATYARENAARPGHCARAISALEILSDWLKAQPARTAKRKGGIGRR